MNKNKNIYSVLSNDNEETHQKINTHDLKNIDENEVNSEEIFFGTIKNIVGYGIFVDVGIGFNGLLHITQISKVLKKHIWNPNDIYDVNQKIPVKILSIDKSNQKILLELVDLKIKKKSEENWDNLNNFPISIFKDISEKVKNKDFMHCFSQYHKYISIQNNINSFFKNNNCAITKQNFENDNIGLKINIERYPNSSEISYITPSIDYISLTGFEKGNFTEFEEEWIPICVKESDLTLVEERLAKIYNLDKFYVWMVNQTFPFMLNTIVVHEITNQNPSNKYFIRYLHLSHIFVLFAKKYPEIRRLSDKKIYSFMSNDWNRSKKSTPSIGALISTLLVSENYSWVDLAYPSLTESFSRNVKWVLNHHPELVENLVVDSNRNDKTFKSTIGSLKLLMLHVGYQKIVKVNSDFWKCYDFLKTTNGIPTEDILNEISEFRKKFIIQIIGMDFLKELTFPSQKNHT